MKNIMVWAVFGVFVIMNIVCFLFMGADKKRAVKGKWRIREKTLFMLSILFGALGGTIGMHVFHHKTRVARFAVVFPLLAVLQCCFIVWLILKVNFGVNLLG